MIPCPKCGSDTEVKETRSMKSGNRRRRYCENQSCGGRVTTYEIPAKSRSPIDSAVIVDAADLEAIRRLAADALEGGRGE